jgi:hypothetical protein
VRAAWDPIWGSFGAGLQDQFYAGLGEGLVSFLWVDRDRRLVTKSPAVRHLERFFTFFSSARLLILVRDGRSVVQSSMDTFGWDFDRACRAWAAAADTIHRFQQAESGRAERWRVVRYEDLVDDTERELRLIFEFLGLDAARYDFDAGANLPVRGSSWFGRQSTRVHWETVPKDASFAPKERWRTWSDEQLERFEWLAGEQLHAFGYSGSPPRIALAGSVRHTVRDWRWSVERAARWAIYRTRVRAGTASRPLRRRLGFYRDT